MKSFGSAKRSGDSLEAGAGCSLCSGIRRCRVVLISNVNERPIQSLVESTYLILADGRIVSRHMSSLYSKAALLAEPDRYRGKPRSRSLFFERLGTRGQYHSDSRREQALCSKDPWRIGQHQLVAWDSFGRPISLYPFNLILVDHVYRLPPVILCTSGLGIPSSSLKSLEWLKSNRIAQLQHTDDRRSFYPIDQKCTMDMPSCLSRQFQQYSGDKEYPINGLYVFRTPYWLIMKSTSLTSREHPESPSV